MKNIDTIEPVFYVTEDNKIIINQIENKLKLIDIDNNIKKEIYKLNLELDPFIHH